MNFLIKFCQLVGTLNFLKPGIRYRLIKILLKVFAVKDFEFNTTFFNYNYRGNTSNHIDWYVYYFKAYEHGILLLIKKLINPTQNKIFFDIGANTGHHSLFASGFCNEVHSFEPYLKVQNKIREKIETNSINNILIHPFGLGENDEELTYFEPDDSNTGMGTFIEGKSQTTNSVLLNIKNGDQFISETKISLPDVIKIDIEGFEVFALTGLKETILRSRPAIIMEYCDETKNYFKNYKNFKRFFPENYNFYTIENPNSMTPKLIKFDFIKSGYKNILIIPKEKSCFL